MTDFGQTSKHARIDKIIDGYHIEMAETRRNADDDTNIELEIRIKNITVDIFEKFLSSLFNKEIEVKDPFLVQSVEGMINGNRQFEKLIREIVYVDCVPRSQEYRIKKRIGNSVRMDYGIVPFSINLSVEESMTEFSLESSPVIRVKSRLRFAYPAANPEWYIDTTVAQQLVGRAVNRLPHAVNRMFGRPVEPEHMLETVVGSFKDDFKYEIEIERINKREKDNLNSYDVLDMVRTIFTVFNPNFTKEALYQSELGFVATLIHRATPRCAVGLKRLLPAVRSLSRKTYRSIYPPLSFYLTEKADGIRGLAVLRAGNCYVLADDLYEFKKRGHDGDGASVDGDSARGDGGPAGCSHSARLCDSKSTTVLDGEFLPKLNKFLSFDVIAFKGENFTQKTFRERQRVLAAASDLVRNYGLDVAPKRFYQLTDEDSMRAAFHELRRKIDDGSLGYETDGVILTEPGKTYVDTVSYKWKDKEHSTIDFLARRCPGRMDGRPPYVKRPGFDLYFLFSAASASQIEKLKLVECPGYKDLFAADAGQEYRPIQFSPSTNPRAYMYYHPDTLPNVDNLVVEMRCDEVTAGPPEWLFVRDREDKLKDRGGIVYNNIAVAEETWMMILEDFPYADLYDPKTSYFATTKSMAHKAHAAASSALKAKKIMDFTHAAWVVDLGVGQGQDLKRYMDAQVGNLIGVDCDKTALVTLTERKYNILRRFRDCSPLSVSLVCGGAADADIVDKILNIGLSADGADLVVSNYSINYFCSDLKTLRAFLATCSILTRLGGSLIITTFSGQKIMSELVNRGVERGHSWDLKEDGAVKFSIRRRFEESVLSPAGQAIDVILPFSNGEYYSEYLVNPATVQEILGEFGFDKSDFTNMSAFVSEFKIKNPGLGEKLTERDLEWLSLQIQMTFKKNRRKAIVKKPVRRFAKKPESDGDKGGTASRTASQTASRTASRPTRTRGVVRRAKK